MRDPSIFVLIHGRQKRYYAADSFLIREIAWGPEALEAWLAAEQEIDGWLDEPSDGVVVNFDRQRLVWNTADGSRTIPRVAKVYDQLLQAAWPGFQIVYGCRGMKDLAEAAGDSYDYYEDESDEYFDTVREAAGLDDEDDENDDEDDEVHEEFFEDEECAWVTLIDPQGAVHHRKLSEISHDLIQGNPAALKQIAKLAASEIPAEAVVSEGMWIDQANRQVGYWGNDKSVTRFARMQKSWKKWTVSWANGGYTDQCAISGPSGVPMSDAEALAIFVPRILSTERFDMSTMFNAMGGHLKKTAIKATGCFLIVICSPVLLFGVISGNWKAAGITVAIVAAVVTLIFKALETKLKRNFAPPGIQPTKTSRPTVAGSTQVPQRRRQLDQSLSKAGLPSLQEIEPYYDSQNELAGFLN